MVCVIRDSKPSFQRISIAIWVFTYSMDSLHHHKYKCNSIHSNWTRYMAIMSSKTYFGQIKSTVTRNICFDKTTWSNIHLKKIHKLEGAASSYVNGIIFPLIWMLGIEIYIYEMTMCFKVHCFKLLLSPLLASTEKQGWDGQYST